MASLVLGIVGNSPAVFSAALTPLADGIAQAGDGEVHVLLGVTRDTARHFDKLAKMPPLNSWNCKSVQIEPKEEFEKTVREMLERSLEYDGKIFLFLKGGVGHWVSRLLWLTRDIGATHFVIKSDGNNVILAGGNGNDIETKELADVGLETYLDLNGLKIVASGKTSDASGMPRTASNWKHDVSLQRKAANPVQVNFRFLFERHGFLYAGIDTTTLLEDEDTKYQVAFRVLMDKCRSLTLETGRVVLGIPVYVKTDKLHEKEELLKKRTVEAGVTFVSLDNVKKRRYVPLAVRLDKLAKDANPGNAVPRKGTLGNAKPESKTFAHPEGKRVLLMALSRPDAAGNLVALSTHSPNLCVVVYDGATVSIREGARRLLDVAQECCPGIERIEFVESDHLGSGVLDRIPKLRQRLAEEDSPYSGSWDFNLTPGTKEQTDSLIQTSQQGDRLWSLDKRGANAIRIDGTGSEPGLPQNHPGILPVAKYVGGPLREKGMRMIPASLEQSGALQAAKDIFSFLKENEGPLSAVSNDKSFVWCEAGTLKTRDGREYTLESLFPRFDFAGDENRWFEAFVAAALVDAGADEVICNLKWQWYTDHDRRPDGWHFRDELDIAARFGTNLIAVSCKTGNYDDLRKDRWEIDYVASTGLGVFTRAVLAVPYRWDTPAHATAPEAGSRAKTEGCRTKIIDSSLLAGQPGELREWLLNSQQKK
jgi:hypothetical protein